MAELSELESSGGVSRLRARAAELYRRIRAVTQQMEGLAAQEAAGMLL